MRFQIRKENEVKKEKIKSSLQKRNSTKKEIKTKLELKLEHEQNGKKRAKKTLTFHGEDHRSTRQDDLIFAPHGCGSVDIRRSGKEKENSR